MSAADPSGDPTRSETTTNGSPSSPTTGSNNTAVERGPQNNAAPKPFVKIPAPIVPNTVLAAQPDAAPLPKDPDPMIQALIDNMLSIERSLFEIQHRAKLFLDSAAFMCRSMGDQATHLATLCKNDTNLAEATTNFAKSLTMSSNAGSPSYNLLVEYLDLKVFGPIVANIEAIREIKKHIHERAAVKKKASSWFATTGNDLFVDPALDAKVFEELSDLDRHRFDVIRGIYEGLRQAQSKFFSNMADVVSSPSVEPPPKTPISTKLRPTKATPYPPATVTPEFSTSGDASKKAETTVARPTSGSLDPTGDKARLSDGKSDDEFDANVEDFEEYEKRTRGASVGPSSPTRLTQLNGTKQEQTHYAKEDLDPTIMDI